MAWPLVEELAASLLTYKEQEDIYLHTYIMLRTGHANIPYRNTVDTFTLVVKSLLDG